MSIPAIPGLVLSPRTRAALFAAGLCLSVGACGMAAPPARYAQSSGASGESVVTEAERPVLLARNMPDDDSAPPPQQQGQGPDKAAEVATDVSTTRAEPELKKAIVVEGWITLEVEEVPQVADHIRARVQELGGSIVNDQMTGGERSWSGYMKVKLPPETVQGFVAWLGQTGDITSKRIQGTDVSRTLFDQAIALENLQLTLDRMRKLLQREGLEMKDILAIENEMTRLRGEIERIKGEKRYLEHRVAMATLDISLQRREGVILGRAKAKFYPGARVSAMYLLDAGDRESMRMGGGVVVHTIPRLTLELDIFERVGDEPRAVVATFGGATYSDFLGRGRRSYLNPYLGLRLGYGYLDGSAFVFAGTGGVELFKHKYVLVDATVNVLGFARSSFDVAVTGGLGVVFAF